MTNKEICPKCGKAELITLHGTFRFRPPSNIPGGTIAAAHTEWQKCPACGETTLPPALSNAVEREGQKRSGGVAVSEPQKCSKCSVAWDKYLSTIGMYRKNRRLKAEHAKLKAIVDKLLVYDRHNCQSNDDWNAGDEVLAGEEAEMASKALTEAVVLAREAAEAAKETK